MLVGSPVQVQQCADPLGIAMPTPPHNTERVLVGKTANPNCIRLTSITILLTPINLVSSHVVWKALEVIVPFNKSYKRMSGIPLCAVSKASLSILK